MKKRCNVSELEKHLEIIAEKVHADWMKKKIEEGWVYGDVRNDSLKTSPNIVKYEYLSENQKEYDRITVRATLYTLMELGYDIYG